MGTIDLSEVPSVDDNNNRDSSSLYEWQIDALTTWLRCGRRGVIEAVTGSGKTNLAIAAIVDAHRRGLFVLVIVPSRVLIDQWHERLTVLIPDCKIGRLGDNYRDRPEDCDVLITTRHSAASHRPLPPGDAGGLLIADECHGYGGGKLRKSLLHQYGERLGLTATLERSDDAVEKSSSPTSEGSATATTSSTPFETACAPSPGWPSSRCRFRKRNVRTMWRPKPSWSPLEPSAIRFPTCRLEPVRRLPGRGRPPWPTTMPARTERQPTTTSSRSATGETSWPASYVEVRGSWAASPMRSAMPMAP